MNREVLVEALITQPDIRVWQQIRNQSPYSHVYGAPSPAPHQSDYPDRASFLTACETFVAALQDTFNRPNETTPHIPPLDSGTDDTLLERLLRTHSLQDETVPEGEYQSFGQVTRNTLRRKIRKGITKVVEADGAR